MGKHHRTFSYPIPRPTTSRRPMCEAPQDGRVILVEQRRARPGLDAKYDIVPAKWHVNSPGTPVPSYWRMLHTSAAGRQSHQLLGWWPL